MREDGVERFGLRPDGATIELESNEEFWHARWKGLHGTGPTISEALENLGDLMGDAYSDAPSTAAEQNGGEDGGE